MKNLVKKNQLMITALAIMIAIAGYLQFAGTNLEGEYLTMNQEGILNGGNQEGLITDNYSAQGGTVMEEDELLLDLSDEDLMSAGIQEIPSLDTEVDVVEENYLNEDMQVAQATPKEGEIPGEAVFTAANGVNVLSEAKLIKEQTRAKNKETLLEIINSDGLTDQQKQDAVNSIVEMTSYAEKEAAAEILLEAKGFSGVVVSMNGDGVDVVVNAIELSEIQRAQIEDIVNRKTEIMAENIVISTLN